MKRAGKSAPRKGIIEIAAKAAEGAVIGGRHGGAKRENLEGRAAKA